MRMSVIHKKEIKEIMRKYEQMKKYLSYPQKAKRKIDEKFVK